MSPGVLANKIGTSCEAVRRWMRDKYKPRIDNISKLARALGVSAWYLDNGKEDKTA